MKFYFSLPIFLSICFLMTFGANADEAKKTVYVWSFAMRDRSHSTTTDNLTEEFEIALSDAQKYSILDRKNVDNLVRQSETESGAVDASGIPDKAKSILQLQGADMVIFGEVFDDLSDGVFTVTVTFEDWKGEKHLIKEVDIPRDQISNKSARESAMADLVKKIVSGTRAVLKAESHSFLVEVTKCAGQGEDVTVDLQVTNNDGLDRLFGLRIDGFNGEPSAMFDNEGNRAVAKYARISNQESSSAGVRCLLISGTPVKCALEFRSVPERADTISRLFVSMGSGGRGGESFDLTFKNIPIERE